MLRVGVVSAVVVAVFLMCAVIIEARCSSQTECVECLLASPAFSFGLSGEYCKACPIASLSQKYPLDDDIRKNQGDIPVACWDEDSADKRAQNTLRGSEPRIGGCLLETSQSAYQVDGWLIPGNTHSQALDKSTRIKDRTTIERLCNSTRHLFHTSAPTSPSASDAPPSTGLARLSGEEVLKAQHSFQVVAQLEREILLILRLYAVDPAFVSDTFPEFAALQRLGQDFAMTTVKNIIGITIPFSGYIITGIELGLSASTLLEKEAEPLYIRGGDANTYLFPELTYGQLFSVYLDILKKVKTENVHESVYLGAKALLLQLKKEGDERASSAHMAAQTAASVAHKVNSHPATITAKVGVHALVAALTLGISVPISIAIAGGEFVADKSLEAADSFARVDKLAIIMAGLYAAEGSEFGYFLHDPDVKNIFPESAFVKGKLFCDVTDYSKPNHGCAAGLRCIRGPRVFFPLNETLYQRAAMSRFGLCSPVYHIRVGTGSPCSLDSDCHSSYCSMKSTTLSIQYKEGSATHKKNFTIDARARALRGDMKNTYTTSPKALDVATRLYLLTGTCKLAALKDSSGCQEILPEYNFWECDKPVPDKYFEEAPPIATVIHKFTDDMDVTPARHPPKLKRADTAPASLTP